MELVDILGNFNAGLLVLMILSGIPTCFTWKKNGTTGEMSPTPFTLGYFNTGLWLLYSYFIRIPAMFFVGIFGMVMNVGYISCYYVYAPDKASIRRQAIILTSILAFLSFYTIYIAAPDKGEWLAGLVASTTTLFFIAAPLADLGKVIKNKSTECLPTNMVFGNLILSALNLWYAYLLNDLFMLLPNLFGTVVSILTASLYFIYPSKSIKTKKS